MTTRRRLLSHARETSDFVNEIYSTEVSSQNPPFLVVAGCCILSSLLSLRSSPVIVVSNVQMDRYHFGLFV
jgi:hypothetical protein